MQAEEKQEMLELLAASRETLREALEGLTNEAATFSPAPDRWSVVQCVEHVAMVEEGLLRRVTSAAPVHVPMRNEEREATIRARGADRRRKVPAPDGVQPRGRFPTLEEALAHFSSCRERTMEFVRNNSADLRCHITEHPLLGTVNCYETLLIMAAHPKRHAAQIAEIRAEFATSRSSSAC